MLRKRLELIIITNALDYFRPGAKIIIIIITGVRHFTPRKSELLISLPACRQQLLSRSADQYFLFFIF